MKLKLCRIRIETISYKRVMKYLAAIIISIYLFSDGSTWQPGSQSNCCHSERETSTLCCLDKGVVENCSSCKGCVPLTDIPCSSADGSSLCHCSCCVTTSSSTGMIANFYGLVVNPNICEFLRFPAGKIVGINHEPTKPPPQSII